MNTDWHHFLQNSGAVFHDNGDTEFHGKPSGNCQKMDLSYLGILRITGEDKQTFLQGQLTNDTRNLEENKSQLSSYCTPKGRMLANFRIYQQGEAWFLLLPRKRLDAVFKRLSMFVLRSNVKIEDVSEDLISIGMMGDCIADKLGANLPGQSDDVVHQHGVTFIRVETEHPRYIAIGDYEAVHDLWNKLDKAIQVSTSQWRLYDIRAAIPMVYEETVEAFIPQMTNLQLLNGVSFTKGCYTGQEVVARMQYLGKLKRRMYPVSFETAQVPKPGDDIYSSSSQSGQGAGKLVDAVQVGDNQYEALAVLEINNIGEGEFQLYDSNGPVIKVSDPPYPFEIDDE